LELCILCPLISKKFGDQFLNFDLWKSEDWKTSNHFHSFNTLMIKHYNLSIHEWHSCVLFSYVNSKMSSFKLYGYNIIVIDKTYQNVVFLLNLWKISRSLRHLGVNGLVICGHLNPRLASKQIDYLQKLVSDKVIMGESKRYLLVILHLGGTVVLGVFELLKKIQK